MHKTIVYVLLVYREKALAEISEEFTFYKEIPSDLNSTYSQGSSSQRTSTQKFCAHIHGQLRVAVVIVKNLLKSYGMDKYPLNDNFNERELNIMGSDGIQYNFASYHSLINEIKKPTSTDKKYFF